MRTPRVRVQDSPQGHSAGPPDRPYRHQEVVLRDLRQGAQAEVSGVGGYSDVGDFAFKFYIYYILWSSKIK